VFGSSKQNTHQESTTNGESSENTVILPTDAAPLSPTSLAMLLGPLPASLSFTPAEAMLPRQQLFRLLRRQIHWATQEETELAQELDALERQRREEWLAKELVMENLLEASFRRANKMGVFGEQSGDQSGEPSRGSAIERKKSKAWKGNSALRRRAFQDLQIAEALPVGGAIMPWYRGPDGIPSGGMGLDGVDEEDEIESSPEEHDDVDETEFPQDETMDGDVGRQNEVVQRGVEESEVIRGDRSMVMPGELERDTSLGPDDTEKEEAD